MESILKKASFIIDPTDSPEVSEKDLMKGSETLSPPLADSMEEAVKSNQFGSKEKEDNFFELIVNEDDQSFSFTKSDKFDSDIFLKSVLKGLKKIKDKNFKHNLKLFICKAFRIPMNSLEPDLADSDFIDSLKDEVSQLDVDPNVQVGAVGFSSQNFNDKGDSLEEDLESLQL